MVNRITQKQITRYLRTFKLLECVLLTSIICLEGCQDAATTQGFLTDPVSENPYPPYVWNPFEEWNMLNPDGSGTRTRMDFGYDATEMNDSILTYRMASHTCASRVVSLNVYTSPNDTTRGALVFNMNLRRPDLPNRFPPGMNNNQNLGQAGDFYKFEVEVIFEGEEGCFYGQMISNFVSITETGTRSFDFHDDSPANQWDKYLQELVKQIQLLKKILRDRPLENFNPLFAG